MREQGGRKLLREWLSPEQLAQYDAHNYFKVTGCHIGKRYRIRHGMGANVYELLRWSTADWLVLRTQASSRRGDVMLVQKIALETDERNAVPESWLFATANGIRLGPRDYPIIQGVAPNLPQGTRR